MTGHDPATEHPHLRLVRAYLDAIASGAPEEALAGYYAPELQQREYPNRVAPNGAERTREQALAGRVRGRQVVGDERYEIRDALVQGDRVAIELTWTARLKIALGDARPGDALRADCGVFFTIRDGRIVRQSNYDCFAPF